jgi:propanediol dehydratase large subunit
VYDIFRIGDDDMPDRNLWEERAANLLKSELKRRGVTYAQLVEKLAALGVTEDERNVRNKLSRGKFTAAWMLECLEAIGAHTLHLQEPS